MTCSVAADGSPAYRYILIAAVLIMVGCMIMLAMCDAVGAARMRFARERRDKAPSLEEEEKEEELRKRSKVDVEERVRRKIDASRYAMRKDTQFDGTRAVRYKK